MKILVNFPQKIFKIMKIQSLDSEFKQHKTHNSKPPEIFPWLTTNCIMEWKTQIYEM